MRSSKSTFVVLIAAIACLSMSTSLLAQSTLYSLNVNGNGNLLTIDFNDTGKSTSVTPTLSLGPGSWNGLSAHPTDSSVIYAVNNPRPLTLDDPQFSRLSRIDLETGTATPFPLFDGTELGSAEIFSSALAISPLEPDVAVVVGSDTEFPPNPFIWKVNLADGSIAETVRPLNNVRRLEAITFSADGSRLLGTDEAGRLVSLDEENAEVSVIGDPNLSSFLTGLAFDPGDENVLYAIEGGRVDRLITLDPSNGEVLSFFRTLGNAGPEGLAFVGTPDVGVDLDCSGDDLVSALDLACSNANDTTSQLLAELGLFAGDLDGQNGVGFPDFIVLTTNYLQQTNNYQEGDINDDGMVGFGDFLELSGNFGKGLAAPAGATASVPEPSSVWLLLGAMLIGGSCGRRRIRK